MIFRLASRLDPGTITVLKGNKPLCLRIHRQHRLARVNTSPEDNPETILRLFVYSTLKRSYWNHQRFCAQARSIEPAVV